MFASNDWSLFFHVFYVSTLVMLATITYRMVCKTPLGSPFKAHKNLYFRAVAIVISIVIMWIPLYLGVHWLVVVPISFLGDLGLQKIADNYIR